LNLFFQKVNDSLICLLVYSVLLLVVDMACLSHVKLSAFQQLALSLISLELVEYLSSLSSLQSEAEEAETMVVKQKFHPNVADVIIIRLLYPTGAQQLL
jgi:hypothetical protein